MNIRSGLNEPSGLSWACCTEHAYIYMSDSEFRFLLPSRFKREGNPFSSSSEGQQHVDPSRGLGL